MIVSLRSLAVIPVFAWPMSIGVMNAVFSGASFCATTGFRSSRLQTSGRIETHNWPRPESMKLTISGVAFSAAQIKSPSFSRSSASTTITTSPRRIASTASGTEFSSMDMFDLWRKERESGRATGPQERDLCHHYTVTGESSHRPPVGLAEIVAPINRFPTAIIVTQEPFFPA